MNTKNIVVILIVFAIIGVFSFSAVSGIDVGGLKLTSISEQIKLGLDIEGGVVLVYEAQTDKTGSDLAILMNQTKSVIERRINEMGLTEPKISVVNTNRIRVELPGVDNAEEAIAQVGKTAVLEFAVVPSDTVVTTGMKFDDSMGKVMVTGDMVKDSQTSRSDQTGQVVVTLEFNSEGADLFEQATREVSAYHGQIAIILDGEVISAPRADKAIPNGKSYISGNFTIEEATMLSSLIRGGALPVELEEVQSQVIGPTLGKDALDSSLNAAKIGFLLVVVFMILYYRIPGFVASSALVLYASLILFLMVGLGATLTLPGVAGIVLSVGMAVDANVIIFERLKEEMRDGRSVRAAVDAGFSKALRTIMDANITTLIAAVVLYNFGEGAIKGFAVTLMIGIVTSMFTAIIVTKTLLKSFVGIKGLATPALFGAKEAK